MPTIRPISDLRNNFAHISQIVHQEQEPIFLTKNGVGDMVVMSIEYYEKHFSRLDLYQKLDDAERQIKEGAQGIDYKVLLDSLRKNIHD